MIKSLLFVLFAGVGIGRGRGISFRGRHAATPPPTTGSSRRFSDNSLRKFQDGTGRLFSS